MFKLRTDSYYINILTSRTLQVEYDLLKLEQNDRHDDSPTRRTPDENDNQRDAEMIAEAKLLRQHKGRLEARMQILEDHNRQLDAQLQRLRQLLEQVSQGREFKRSDN